MFEKAKDRTTVWHDQIEKLLEMSLFIINKKVGVLCNAFATTANSIPAGLRVQNSTLGATMVETVIDQKSNFKTKEGEK